VNLIAKMKTLYTNQTYCLVWRVVGRQRKKSNPIKWSFGKEKKRNKLVI
jgi:hypothetical protein